MDLFINTYCENITFTNAIKTIVNDHIDKISTKNCVKILKRQRVDSETKIKLYELLKKDYNEFKALLLENKCQEFNHSQLRVKEYILNNVDEETGKTLINHWTTIKIQFEKINIKNECLKQYANDKYDAVTLFHKLNRM